MKKSNDYTFLTIWRLRATPNEVGAILGDSENLARWWPSVYLAVDEVEPGDERGLGKIVDLHTKGWLPYTLRWRLEVVDIRDDGFSIGASGDFDGRGEWTIEQDGPDTVIRYDWRVRAEKPLLRYLSAVMKPIFSANHHWAMEQGRRSLELELARRRATSDAERARIPPPPGVSASRLPLAAIALAAVALALLGWRRLRKGHRVNRPA